LIRLGFDEIDKFKVDAFRYDRLKNIKKKAKKKNLFSF